VDHLTSAFLLAISANVDNVGVGLVFGVRGRNIRLAHNLLISLVSGGATLLSMAAGEWVNDFMSEELANLLGSAILCSIGVYGVVLSARRANGAPPVGEPGAASTSEAVALAVSLSLNNLVSGLGAGISHVSIGLTAALTAALSIAALAGGQLAGRRSSALPFERGRLDFAAGLILIAVGIHELFI
jgi:putative Mn2+ efflux pump MntP